MYFFHDYSTTPAHKSKCPYISYLSKHCFMSLPLLASYYRDINNTFSCHVYSFIYVIYSLQSDNMQTGLDVDELIMGMASQIAEREDNIVVEDLRGSTPVLDSGFFVL